MSLHDLARDALEHGVRPTRGADFAPGEARALATDRLEKHAVVLVVRLRRDEAWIIDLVDFEAVDGNWQSTGSSGGTYGDLRLDYAPGASPEIATVSTGVRTSGDTTVAYAGGLVHGPVEEVELITPIAQRRVVVGVNKYAFVAVAPGVEPPGTGLRFDPGEEPRVRAFSGGAVVDDTAEWDRERDASFADTVTVAEALASPPGTVVTVRGVVLRLKDHSALLCDEIDTKVQPPRPLGAVVRLAASSGPPSWDPDTASFSAQTMIATGVIRDDLFVPRRAD